MCTRTYAVCLNVARYTSRLSLLARARARATTRACRRSLAASKRLDAKSGLTLCYVSKFQTIEDTSLLDFALTCGNRSRNMMRAAGRFARATYEHTVLFKGTCRTINDAFGTKRLTLNLLARWIYWIGRRYACASSTSEIIAIVF